jgi:uncharacterized membrane protein (UPF0127 family)
MNSAKIIPPDGIPSMALSGRTFAVAFIIIVGLLVVYTVYQATNVPGTVTSKVPSGFTVYGKTYTFTYVATTQAERQQGLMNRRVTNTTTELFAFPSSGEWQFWMYDTNTSLDMIWINATGLAGRVVYIVTSAQPCYDSSTCEVYTPTAPANYVIEARAGFVAANGVVVGTQIQFS